MNDEPGPKFGHYQLASLSMDFETALVVTKGAGKIKIGDVLSNVQWGFSYTAAGSLGNKYVVARKYYVNNIVWGDDQKQTFTSTDLSGEQKDVVIGGPSKRPDAIRGMYSIIPSAKPSTEMTKALDLYFGYSGSSFGGGSSGGGGASGSFGGSSSGGGGASGSW